MNIECPWCGAEFEDITSYNEHVEIHKERSQ